MNLVKYILVVLFAVPIVFSSCRKGDDDPFISFKSREKRLVGTWILKKLSGSYEYNTENSFYTKAYGYDVKTDESLRITEVSQSGGNAYCTDNFNCYLYMYEDNSLRISYRFNGGPNWDDYGEWYWIDKGKKKEYVGMEGAFEFIYPYDHDFKIIGLSMDELKLEFDIDKTEIDVNDNEVKLTGLFSYEFEKSDRE